MMEGPDLHAFKVSAAGTDLLRCLSREGHEGDLLWTRDSGPHGVAGFLDHGMRLAGSGAGDDDSAVLLGQDRLTLLRVEAGKGWIIAAPCEEAPVGCAAFCLPHRAPKLVQTPGAHGMAEFPPAFQGSSEGFAPVLGLGVPEPCSWFSRAVILKPCHVFHRGAPCGLMKRQEPRSLSVCPGWIFPPCQLSGSSTPTSGPGESAADEQTARSFT